MNKVLKITLIVNILSVFILSFSNFIFAAETKPKKNLYEDTEVYMRLVLRTPEQLIAFYQGREFKQEAIDKILETCYVTPIVKNKKFDVLWLELDSWQFLDINNKPISRIKRDYWKEQWQEIKLKRAHQSTFGWTLMPEVRDLRFDEGVGGSVILPWQTKPFTVIANFPTGADKNGPVKSVTFKGVECKTDIEQE